MAKKMVVHIDYVEICEECYYQDYLDYNTPLCMRTDKPLDYLDEIPDWCPLEDEKEEKGD